MRKFLRNTCVSGCATIAALSTPLTAEAGLSTFYGIDYGANNNSAIPESNAAAAAFDVAAKNSGHLGVIDFESTPLGPVDDLTIAPGVVLTGVPNTGGALPSIVKAPVDSQPNYSGFNSTVGGKNFNQIFGGSETFAFATPVKGFGAYISGLPANSGSYTFTFDNGTSLNLPFFTLFEAGIFGGMTFVGVIESGKSISSVTVTIANSLGVPNWAGVDDVRTIPAVPEPAGSLMLGTGLMAILLGRRFGSRCDKS